jgi:hypothetical protein
VTRRAALLTIVTLGIMVASGLYLRVLTRRDVFRPPNPESEEVARARLTEAVLQAQAGPSETATLYFPSPDQALLLEEKRQIKWAVADTDRIRQVLLALIEGSHQGYGRVLPASAVVRSVFLTGEGTAYVDFAGPLLADFSPGIAAECLAAYSIVNSLAANIPAIRQVQILIEGQEADTLAGHVDLSSFFVPVLTPMSSGP